jgi:hypothetical protein
MADDRYSSRKWILTKNALIMYTAVYLIELAVMVFLLKVKLIDAGTVQTMWPAARVIWAAGVGFIIGAYFGVNYAVKKDFNANG